jgi:preprotein translocase subunit SecY
MELYNMFTGGALLKGALFGLGIMPHISASIIIQLLRAINPLLARLQHEGEIGRQKITQYTRYLTVLICLIQGWLLVMALANDPDKLLWVQRRSVRKYYRSKQRFFFITSTFFLTASTLILMWTGEQISQIGIGNRVSLLIAAGILSSIPGAIMQAVKMFGVSLGTSKVFGIWQGFLMIGLLVSVVAFMISVTQADRKRSVQYVSRIVGRKMYADQSSYLSH